VHGQLPHQHGGDDVDALLDAPVAEGLRAEQPASGRFKEHLEREFATARVVARVVFFMNDGHTHVEPRLARRAL